MPIEVKAVFKERANQKGILFDDYLKSTLSAQELELSAAQLKVIKRHAKDYLNDHPEEKAKVMYWHFAITTRVYEVYN